MAQKLYLMLMNALFLFYFVYFLFSSLLNMVAAIARGAQWWFKEINGNELKMNILWRIEKTHTHTQTNWITRIKEIWMKIVIMMALLLPCNYLKNAWLFFATFAFLKFVSFQPFWCDPAPTIHFDWLARSTSLSTRERKISLRKIKRQDVNK